MGTAASLHGCIEKYNLFTKPTNSIGEFLDHHPLIYKIALIINHIFRAAALVGIMYIPQVPMAISMPICFVGSIFYRLTVERNCAYKFALPAFVGAAAFMLALPALLNMINGAAFITAASGTAACASFIPLLLYGAYIALTVSYDVDAQLKEKSCCCAKTA